MLVRTFIITLIFIKIAVADITAQTELSENEVQFLKEFFQTQNDKSKIKYDEFITKADKVFSNRETILYKLEEDHERNVQDVDQTNLISAINPSNTTTFNGESYNDKIISIAESTLQNTNLLPDKNDSDRMKGVINNLSESYSSNGSVLGGLLGGLIQSNPVTNLLSSVVGTVSNFFSSKSKNAKKITTAFTSNQVETFVENYSKQLKPYIELYNGTYKLTLDQIEILDTQVEKSETNLIAARETFEQIKVYLTKNELTEYSKEKLSLLVKGPNDELFDEENHRIRTIQEIIDRVELHQATSKTIVSKIVDSNNTYLKESKELIDSINEDYDELSSFSQDASKLLLGVTEKNLNLRVF